MGRENDIEIKLKLLVPLYFLFLHHITPLLLFFPFPHFASCSSSSFPRFHSFPHLLRYHILIFPTLLFFLFFLHVILLLIFLLLFILSSSSFSSLIPYFHYSGSFLRFVIVVSTFLILIFLLISHLTIPFVFLILFTIIETLSETRT